jgi:hypothetical protein
MLPNYGTVLYGQNILIMLLCGIYKSGEQNYLPYRSFVVTNRDVGVLVGQVVSAVICTLLLRRGHGRHYDNHRLNVSGRDVIPIYMRERYEVLRQV